LSSPTRERLSPEARRKEILQAATERALEIGIERLTVREVANAAGVATGLIHHYFDGIHDLVAEVFTSVIGTDLDRLHSYAEDATATTQLQHYFVQSTSQDRSPVLRMWLGAWIEANANEQLEVAVRREMDRGYREIIDLIERGVSTGEFTCRDVESSAWRILVVYDGLAVERTMKSPVFGHRQVKSIVASVIEAELGLSGLLADQA
ncbi:MAG: TetR family transcriptional regulator C-terminal domain-containing protein, partial [Canibacter sp.]